MHTVVKNRILSLPVVLLFVLLINFLLFHIAPGDPTNAYFGPKVKTETYETMRHNMGFDDPWYSQLSNWVSHVLRGDLGYSWSNHRPVREVLGDAIPATVLLASVALLINMGLGCFLGLYAGVRYHRLSGKSLNTLALLFYALPPFWLAIFLVYLFSTTLGWLPPSGMSSPAFESMGLLDTFLDRGRHLILPAFTLGIVGAAATFRFVRANVSSILHEDYIKCATAKGLPRQRVILKHIFRNALLPVITLLGLYLPMLLGGAFIIEVIFAWPGMGRITYAAVQSKDFPLLMAINMVVAIFVIIGNFLADVLYHVVDPRVRLE